MQPEHLYNENLSRERYTRLGYNHGARWMSYFHQWRLIVGTGCTSVLEIGPGHGWLLPLFTDFGITVKTVDINPALKPDYVADVGSLPLKDGEFDVVCAFEVLEHMPFELFAKNLTEMARVARTHVIISLPDHRRTLINFSLKLPFVPELSLFIKAPGFYKKPRSDRHYWEIGMHGYPPSRIVNEIKKTGLRLQKSFVPPNTPANHYFVMTKQKDSSHGNTI